MLHADTPDGTRFVSIPSSYYNPTGNTGGAYKAPQENIVAKNYPGPWMVGDIPLLCHFRRQSISSLWCSRTCTTNRRVSTVICCIVLWQERWISLFHQMSTSLHDCSFQLSVCTVDAIYPRWVCSMSLNRKGPSWKDCHQYVLFHCVVQTSGFTEDSAWTAAAEMDAFADTLHPKITLPLNLTGNSDTISSTFYSGS